MHGKLITVSVRAADCQLFFIKRFVSHAKETSECISNFKISVVVCTPVTISSSQRYKKYV